MKNQEMMTILDALATKKSWISKQYNKFCADWAEMTAGVKPAEKVYIFNEGERSSFPDFS